MVKWPRFESWRRRHYVGWVCCWFSPLLQEVFLRVLRFSHLLKNQHFQIPIRSGTHGHVSTSSYELLSDPWVNKLQQQQERLQAEDESTQPRDNTTATQGEEQKWLQERERRRERSCKAQSDKKRKKTGSAGKEKRGKKHEEEEQDRIRKEKEDQHQQRLEKRAKSKCHHCGQLGHYKCECRNLAPPRRLQKQLVYNFHGPGKLFINKE